jgi:microsomal dipeptidase-like Zn-dependent dipeptidase
MIPSIYQPVADPFETVETIKAVGAERCIIASDFGQVLHLDTVDGIRIMIRALLGFGISQREVEVMIKRNPARLLYLDD